MADSPVEKNNGIYSFEVHSSMYQECFRVNVAEDESVTDDYYSIALREEAQVNFEAAVGDTLPGADMSYAVGIISLRSKALSGKLFSSVSEAQDACGGRPLVRLTVKTELGEDEIKSLLQVLSERNLYCELSVSGDYREFEIAAEGVSYTAASGSDGGSYIKRFEYSFED